MHIILNFADICQIFSPTPSETNRPTALPTESPTSMPTASPTSSPTDEPVVLVIGGTFHDRVCVTSF